MCVGQKKKKQQKQQQRKKGNRRKISKKTDNAVHMCTAIQRKRRSLYTYI